MARQIHPSSRIGTLLLAAAFSGFGIAGCSDDSGSTNADALPGRWYTAEQVTRGKEVYDANCATCHGPDAAGDPNWRKRDTDGFFPPPPLNGTAHAWHHPLVWLNATITNGGQARMPAWGDQLSAADIEATIAWFQSLWPEEIYAVWSEGNTRYESQGGG